MYCGNCLRDNALVEALRHLNHEVLMVPLYLPLTLDEPDQSSSTPIFFSGINVYLEQKSAWFRHAPNWLHRFMASRPLLKLAADRAAKTRSSELGDLTLSMLRGEEGNQARELEELLGWLKAQPRPDVVFLSNLLLLGLARRIRTELRAPVVCMLQGEDYFLNGLPEPQRSSCWELLAQRSADVDQFVSPSQYFADLMRERLGLPPDRVQVVHNGINLEGYDSASAPLSDGLPADVSPGASTAPVLGYFARMCPEKGLDLLVEAFIQLRQRGRVGELKLYVGGSCGPVEKPFVDSLRRRLETSGLLAETQFSPNLDRHSKQAFLRSLSVFSVPAVYGEAFGLYLLEALAAGVPVVQPRSGAFTELIESTGGGLLCAPGDPQSLAQGIEGLLLDPQRARQLAQTGRRNVIERFSAAAMARRVIRVMEMLRSSNSCVTV